MDKFIHLDSLTIYQLLHIKQSINYIRETLID